MEFASEEKLKSLRISSLDDEEEDDEAQVDETDDADLYNEEDEDDEEQVPVILGFVEKPKNNWSLLRQYFPSKAGGTPAWLDPINLPSEKSSLCDFCSEPLQFLLQTRCTQMQTSLEMSESGSQLYRDTVSALFLDCNMALSEVPYLYSSYINKSIEEMMTRISRAPEQVLRYCRSAKGKALWPVPSGRPSRSDIPACKYCGGTRGFEFQVLPQLLYYFGVQNDVDSLDWATIVVYTCEASCNGDSGYKEEFAWVQLAS
ncbi:unnamed protein product [Fraxinus pennsylvanica]|uniref:Programmed cell death protein 2 C-terminal domain-containing protein n=1 Tax=Fraxinus pennsylvanica TaxID=56036 RepID=A0AAD1ZT34_9LAMI|nr:unnamed protein product [Fraxinus pennsylvanica]